MKQDVKNLNMDILLLAITSFFALKGFLKGFVSTIFSLISVSLIAFLSFKVSSFFGEMLANCFNFSNSFEGLINSKLPGIFSSVEELEVKVKSLGIFYVFLLRLLGNISFEGQLTAGQILAPKLNLLTNKLIAFLIVFVLLCIVFKILYLLLNKFVNSFGLGFLNKTFGGAIGAVEGVLISMLIFFVLTALANFLLNESLLNFVESGVVSSWIYENIIIKSVKLLF